MGRLLGVDEYSNLVSLNVRTELVPAGLQATVLACSFLCCYFKVLNLKETKDVKIAKFRCGILGLLRGNLGSCGYFYNF